MSDFQSFSGFQNFFQTFKIFQIFGIFLNFQVFRNFQIFSFSNIFQKVNFTTISLKAQEYFGCSWQFVKHGFTCFLSKSTNFCQAARGKRLASWGMTFTDRVVTAVSQHCSSCRARVWRAERELGQPILQNRVPKLFLLTWAVAIDCNCLLRVGHLMTPYGLLFQGQSLASWGLTCTHWVATAVCQHYSSCKARGWLAGRQLALGQVKYPKKFITPSQNEVYIQLWPCKPIKVKINLGKRFQFGFLFF